MSTLLSVRPGNRTAPRSGALVAVVLVAVLAATGCADPRTALEDEASCPGSACTDDARQRFDAVAALDRVTKVVRVSRSYGLDSGASAGAEVAADVRGIAGARDVGVAVLRELDAWPGHEFTVAEATVVADPPVEVDYVSRQSADLTNPYFQPCSPAACERALRALRERMTAEIDGLRDVGVEVRGRTLRITGSTAPDQYALAAAGVRRLVFDAALRLADRLEVEMSARGPLRTTLRLQEGRVCEQPPGTTSRCDDDNSFPLGQ